VSVKLTLVQGIVALVIEDDGRGFDVSGVRSQTRPQPGLGLISMKERAQLFGGSLYLTSSPGRGTQVHVEIPLRPEVVREKDKNTHR
jgi:signal transduction histidine kinase